MIPSRPNPALLALELARDEIEAQQHARRLLDDAQVHTLRIGGYPSVTEEEMRGATQALAAVAGDREVFFESGIVVLSRTPVLRDDPMFKRLVGACSFHGGTTIYFDPATRPRVLALLERPSVARTALLEAIALQPFDDRDGALRAAMRSAIDDPDCRDSALRTIRRINDAGEQPFTPELRERIAAFALDGLSPAIDALAKHRHFAELWQVWEDRRFTEPHARSNLVIAIVDHGGPAEWKRVRTIVEDQQLPVSVRHHALAALEEARQAGRVKRWRAVLDDAIARERETERAAWQREELARKLAPAVDADAKLGDIVALRHPDGRTWKVLAVYSGRVQLWIGLADGEVIERVRNAENPNALVEELVAAQRAEGFRDDDG